MRELVLVHGRAQQHKDAAALKGEWLLALRNGLAKSRLELPIAEAAVRFPYYGQTLFDLAAGATPDHAAEVIVRGAADSGAPGASGAAASGAGAGGDSDELAFSQAVLAEVCARTGVGDERIAGLAAGDVVERGPLNWTWVHATLRALDRFVPHASAASIALFTHDVYQYLRNPGLRDRIEMGVREAMRPGVSTVVVSHSLGTIVAYNLLRRDGEAAGWSVPLFVTLGSPLGIRMIKSSLAPNRHPACAGRWFNAMDPGDVVALYPLDWRHFPIDPEIDNQTDVHNDSENRHGITGYLEDPQVARRIHEALVAP
jgi:hypothetical protein